MTVTKELDSSEIILKDLNPIDFEFYGPAKKHIKLIIRLGLENAFNDLAETYYYDVVDYESFNDWVSYDFDTIKEYLGIKEIE